MSWDSLDKKITRNNGYKFFMKHKKIIMLVEGIIIIGLLSGIWVYFYQDWQIKKQVRDTCGFITDDWECICDKNAVDFYKELQKGGKINITFNSNKNMENQNVKLVG